METYRPHKYLHGFIYSIFIHKLQNLEMSLYPMSLHWRVDKQTLVPPQNETLLSNKKELIPDTHNNTDGSQCITPSERSQTQKAAHRVMPFK